MKIKLKKLIICVLFTMSCVYVNNIIAYGTPKPHAPIHIEYTISPKPALHQRSVLTLRVSTAYNMGPIILTIESDEQSIAVEKTTITLDKAKKTKVRVARINFTPEVTGLNYIYVEAQSVKDQNKMTFTKAVPIEIGNQQMQQQKSNQIITDPQGKRLEIMQ